ncbi:hypothetical protein DMI70_26240 [Escherichia coli]|nr:hypothetical protein [Escherichia coli]
MHSHHNLNIQLLKGSLNILFPGVITGRSLKENAEVVLTINNDPLLVFGNYHNGKICFMSDCSPHWGTQQFMSLAVLYRVVGKYTDSYCKIIIMGVTPVTPFTIIRRIDV